MSSGAVDPIDQIWIVMVRKIRSSGLDFTTAPVTLSYEYCRSVVPRMPDRIPTEVGVIE